jgi:hypothetical protein
MRRLGTFLKADFADIADHARNTLNDPRHQGNPRLTPE